MYLEAEGWRYQMCSQSSEGSYKPMTWLLPIFRAAASYDSINHAPCTSGRGMARALRQSQFEGRMLDPMSQYGVTSTNSALLWKSRNRCI